MKLSGFADQGLCSVLPSLGPTALRSQAHDGVPPPSLLVEIIQMSPRWTWQQDGQAQEECSFLKKKRLPFFSRRHPFDSYHQRCAAGVRCTDLTEPCIRPTCSAPKLVSEQIKLGLGPSCAARFRVTAPAWARGRAPGLLNPRLTVQPPVRYRAASRARCRDPTRQRQRNHYCSPARCR